MSLRHILAMTLALAWAALPAARAAEQTTDSAVSQVLLELEVRTALLTKIGVGARDISVKASDGEVWLIGKVADRGTSGTAEDVAKSVEGVKDVHNELKLEAKPAADRAKRVERRIEESVDDGVLELKVKSKLVSELGRSGFGIEVESHQGIVNLSGKVPDAARHQLALDLAAKVAGVKKVVDLLKEP